MKIKIPKYTPQDMTQSGDSILRSLQNNTLPLVDLMVREAIQNSMDASLNNVEFAKVDFTIGKFNNPTLAEHLEDITDVLKEKYTIAQDFLAIKDTNTTGLTGKYKDLDLTVEEEGNFTKLVFGIGKNQTKEGAGGSWGLGKTSFFRMGNGIVIYYTRIKTLSGYEERLIASLIENPKLDDRLLKDSHRGLAWWGEYAKDNDDYILPITDEKSIENILDIFNLPRYKEDETGTTIIIPYLKSDEKEMIIENENPDSIPNYFFERSYASKIKLAVQKWYAPRLNNIEYYKKHKQAYLVSTVNETDVNNEILPLFNLIRELYTSALTGNPSDNNIVVKSINTRNDFINSSEGAGNIAFQMVTKEQMKMVPPENELSPLILLGERDSIKIDKNEGNIMTYCRKPGMLIEYVIDGDWAPKEILEENNLLIGIFVPNSEALLKERYEVLNCKNLESYLRDTENADHANWSDKNKVTLVRRIKSKVIKEINENYKTSLDEQSYSATSTLSRILGNKLLPPRGFGNKGTKTGGTGGTKPLTRGKNASVAINNVKLKEKNTLTINLDLYVPINTRAIISLKVTTSDKKLDKATWFKDFAQNVHFPFEIKEASMENEKLLLEINKNNETLILNNNSKSEVITKVTLTIHSSSNTYSPSITVNSEKFDEQG